MTKAELIDYVADRTGGTKKLAGDAVQAVFDGLSQGLTENGRVNYPGFGTFNVRDRKARTGRNPQTGGTIEIPASKTVGFKPAPKLKDTL